MNFVFVWTTEDLFIVIIIIVFIITLIYQYIKFKWNEFKQRKKK